MKRRKNWIDELRGIAIIAVVFDHIFFLFPQYTNHLFWIHRFFTIPWFVFLSGSANAYAGDKYDFTKMKAILYYWKKRFFILIPYAIVSTIAFFIFYPGKNIDFLINLILNFSAQPTFYFFNIICQMYVLFPVLYLFIKWADTGLRLLLSTSLVFIVMYFFSWLSYQIRAPWPFSPSALFFGGYYLGVFWMGILMAKKIEKNISKFALIIISAFIIAEAAIFLTSGRIITVSDWFWGIWAVLMLFIVKIALDTVRIYKIMKYSLKILELIGIASYTIFILHFFILLMMQKMSILPNYGIMLLLLLALGIPILTHYSYLYLKKTYVK